MAKEAPPHNFYELHKTSVQRPSPIETPMAFTTIDGESADDPISAQLSAEAVDTNEVRVLSHVVGDWRGQRTGIDSHITALQAIELAGQLRAAGEEALRGVNPG